MNKLIALFLIVAAFFFGRFCGRIDGPRISTMYVEPPGFWADSMQCYEPAIWARDAGWHEGRGWTFEHLMIDGSTKTVSGNCSKP